MANLSNQPNNFNYQNSTNYQLIIPNAPTTTWFCTKAKVPDVYGAGAEQKSLHATIYHPGDRAVYNDFSITYLLNEDFENWSELFNWWKNYSMPITHTPRPMRDEELVCDIELICLNNNKKPTHRYVFRDAFPIFLQGPEYDVQVTDIEPTMLEATFRYTYYDFFPLSGLMPPCASEPETP